MKCLVCGYEIPDQANFCRNCGTRVEDMIERAETNVHVSDSAQEKPIGISQSKEIQRDGKNRILFIAIGAVILLFLGVLLGIGLMDKDVDETSGAPMDYYDENYDIVDNDDNSYDNSDGEDYNNYNHDDYDESNYQPPENSTYDVQVAVSDYLETYIEDIQYGAYNKLYSVVERGSNMERTQEKFIPSCNLYEELLGYTYIDTTQIDSSTYHVTTTERYEIYSYESDVEYYLEQKCVYVVRKQFDGSWKVADYAEQIEQLEKFVY